MVLEPEDTAYKERYLKKHGVEYSKKGVVSLKYPLALPYENKWEIIETIFNT